MSEETQNRVEDDSGNLSEEEAIALHRAKRRSCIFKLILIWFSIGATIILVMVYTRSRVNRDPATIQQAVDQFLSMELPPAFYPYSMNDFMGVKLYVYYHEEHLREDGRTTSVFAINIDDRWADQSLEEVRQDFVEDLPKRLNRREFRVKDHRVETVERNGQRIEIDVFTGIQLIDQDFVDGVACFRFVMGPEGPVQAHTLGLRRTFPAEDQIALLASMDLKTQPLGEDP